jgi:heme exporter protein C
MWNIFYQLASPKTFYYKSIQWERVLSACALVFLSLGLIFALYVSPPDYQQGETVRIMYVHVPSALLSMLCFAFMGVLSFILLIWRMKLAGVLLRVTAIVGAGMTALALITGSLWGKPMWGTWWVWDARLTSEFILQMLYLSILAIQSSFRQRESADKAMAILTLVGLVDLPIIHYSVYWWNTLHQGSSFPLGQKPLIDQSMLYPLGLMFAGFFCFSGWMILWRARSEILRRECRASWAVAASEVGCDVRKA